MNQEKFGQFIKDIRKKHNLTQKQLADKYHVTYQAVSKWENGKNMPDTALIKQISKDFDVSLEELFDGEFKKKGRRKNGIFFVSCILIFIFLILGVFLIVNFKNENFEFKTLSSSCESFSISGSIAYNKSKSAIHITNIKYCGGEDKVRYKKIECLLYEANDNIERKISSYVYDKEEKIELDDFLDDVSLVVDGYEKTCKNYSKDSLYLIINAVDDSDKTTVYKIPLKLEDSCE